MTTQLQIQPETPETESKRKLREAQERYQEEQRAEAAPAQRPFEMLSQVSSKPRIGFWTIALAVLAGNVLTGVIAAVLYALTR